MSAERIPRRLSTLHIQMQQVPTDRLPNVPSPPATHLLAAASLFIAVYLGTFLPLAFTAGAFGLGSFYWIALLSAAVATWFAVRVMERGEWSIGVLVAPKLAGRELLHGIGFAALVVGAADALIVAATAMHHARGRGMPWAQLLVIFIPAAVHEEIVFRGYVFQRIRASSRPLAIAVTSIGFAALHGRNEGITALATANLALAGVLLALAYERDERLWFPIGIHLGWNVLSGPILGYDVSGFTAASTLLRTTGSAPAWLGGGAFGIEGSAAMTVVEIAAIVILLRTNRVKR